MRDPSGVVYQDSAFGSVLSVALSLNSVRGYPLHRYVTAPCSRRTGRPHDALDPGDRATAGEGGTAHRAPRGQPGAVLGQDRGAPGRVPALA